jgi:hypothetical protein
VAAVIAVVTLLGLVISGRCGCRPLPRNRFPRLFGVWTQVRHYSRSTKPKPGANGTANKILLMTLITLVLLNSMAHIRS